MKCAVVTVSDSSFLKMRRDESGPAVAARLAEHGWEVSPVEIVPDEREMIAGRLRELCKVHDAVFTTGGTGAAQRDVTPEAVRDVIDREMPGFGERMRAAGLRFTPLSPLSRSLAGTAGAALIVALPGSPKGAVQSLDAILELVPHVVRLLQGQTGH